MNYIKYKRILQTYCIPLLTIKVVFVAVLIPVVKHGEVIEACTETAVRRCLTETFVYNKVTINI